MFSLIFILNLLSELEFFKEINVNIFVPIYLSLLNSPSLLFEMYPFIFLICTQLFFISIFKNNEITIFKYSGLKNSKILIVASIATFILSLIIITVFYNLSSNLKNFYLEIKSNYTTDNKYLAVITKNGLWIKDKIENNTLIINASKIDKNFLINTFISEFDRNYNIIRNIKSEKIDIKSKIWLINNPIVYKGDEKINDELITIRTNFNYKRIQSLFSNLSSLSFLELLELNKNYKQLNISTIEIDAQIFKIISYPFFLTLMTLFSSAVMFRIRNVDSVTFKISTGLFFSVIIYYINNFFFVLGSTEKIAMTISILIPILMLALINIFLLYNINEK